MKLTLHLLSPDDSPTGLRSARIDQWSGRAVCCPRSSVERLRQFTELQGPALYFLLAETATHDQPRVYVGEADGFLSRLASHGKRKDWWSTVVAFSSADGSLTKAGIQWLEASCVADLAASGWCTLENGNAPQLPTIPPEDEEGLRETFLPNVQTLLGVFGYPIFAAPPAGDIAAVASVFEPEAEQAKDFDTIVCPARAEGFERAYLREHAWWAVRIAEKNLPKLKHLALYQVAPISAITHHSEIDRIEPLVESTTHLGSGSSTGKYKIFCKGDPQVLENPVELKDNKALSLQSARYTLLSDILKADTLDDLFA